MGTTSLSSIDELRFRLRGSVHEPGDSAHADARTPSRSWTHPGVV